MSGGVRHAAGLLRVEQSTISGNRATGGIGGGIDSDGLLTILWSTITGNSAAGPGGGLILDVGSATFGGLDRRRQHPGRLCRGPHPQLGRA